MALVFTADLAFGLDLGETQISTRRYVRGERLAYFDFFGIACVSFLGRREYELVEDRSRLAEEACISSSDA